MSGIGPEPDDAELRRLFGELRAADRRATPDFDRVIAAARARAARRRPRVPLAVAAAILLVLAAAGTLRLLQRRGDLQQFWLSGWRSPTAALLRGPGAALLESVPPVSASVITIDILRERTMP